MKGIVQVMPGAIGEEQEDGWIRKPEPASAILPTTTVSVLLLLVTVTDCAALLVFAIWLPKASDGGEIVSTGGCAIPAPVTAMV